MEEIAFNLLLFILSCIFFIQSMQFPKVGAEQYSGLGAGFWPGIVLFLLMITTGITTLASFAKAWRDIRQKSTDSAKRLTINSGMAELEEQKGRRDSEKIRLATGAIILFAYAYVLPLVGFIISTLTFLLAMLALLKETRILVYLVIPSGITGLVTVLFSKVLFVILPRGIGIFSKVSLLFY
jgi:putative tricarboxylic transport membrane protein